MLTETGYEMASCFGVGKFYPEIVDHKSEGDAVIVVAEEAWGIRL